MPRMDWFFNHRLFVLEYENKHISQCHDMGMLFLIPWDAKVV